MIPFASKNTAFAPHTASSFPSLVQFFQNQSDPRRQLLCPDPKHDQLEISNKLVINQKNYFKHKLPNLIYTYTIVNNSYSIITYILFKFPSTKETSTDIPCFVDVSHSWKFIQKFPIR